ncbi:hypothetical protein J6590_031090 [Homalodisca vitripennis]|nr:hypothetical protein J6590_031090 [Homalodisca vitripennis]
MIILLLFTEKDSCNQKLDEYSHSTRRTLTTGARRPALYGNIGTKQCCVHCVQDVSLATYSKSIEFPAGRIPQLYGQLSLTARGRFSTRTTALGAALAAAREHTGLSDTTASIGAPSSRQGQKYRQHRKGVVYGVQCVQRSRVLYSQKQRSPIESRRDLSLGIFFLLYVNDLNPSIQNGKVVQYADGTTLLFVDDLPLDETESTKFLGMFLDRGLIWDVHVDHVSLPNYGIENGIIWFNLSPTWDMELRGSCAQHKLERIFRLKKPNACMEVRFLTLPCLYILKVILYSVSRCALVWGGIFTNTRRETGTTFASNRTAQDRCVQKRTIPSWCQIDQ